MGLHGLLQEQPYLFSWAHNTSKALDILQRREGEENNIYIFLSQGRIYSCGEIKMWRPLSIKTNLGYDNYIFFLTSYNILATDTEVPGSIPGPTKFSE
jgi:hypothetical protein